MLVMTAEAGAREIASLKRQVDHWYNGSLTINDMPSALPTNLYDVGG
jgi:hypothetical protein